MQAMTVEQALNNAKGMTFEKFWSLLMEDRERQAQTDVQIKELETQMKEVGAHVREVGSHVDELTKSIQVVDNNVGGVGNALGGVMEDMFTTNVCSKFNVFGYTFTQTSRDMVIRDKNGKKFVEVDAFLENGEYVMAVEVKLQLEIYDINKHLERLEKLRKCMDEKGDKRKLVGAMAAGLVKQKEKDYAEGKGLYVLVQNGDSVKVSENPDDFICHVW
jgi:hypothetical protein